MATAIGKRLRKYIPHVGILAQPEELLLGHGQVDPSRCADIAFPGEFPLKIVGKIGGSKCNGDVSPFTEVGHPDAGEQAVDGLPDKGLARVGNEFLILEKGPLQG